MTWLGGRDWPPSILVRCAAAREPVFPGALFRTAGVLRRLQAPVVMGVVVSLPAGVRANCTLAPTLGQLKLPHRGGRIVVAMFVHPLHCGRTGWCGGWRRPVVLRRL